MGALGQSVRAVEDQGAVVGDSAGGIKRAGGAAATDLECAGVDCGCSVICAGTSEDHCSIACFGDGAHVGETLTETGDRIQDIDNPASSSKARGSSAGEAKITSAYAAKSVNGAIAASESADGVGQRPIGCIGAAECAVCCSESDGAVAERRVVPNFQDATFKAGLSRVVGVVVGYRKSASALFR